MSEDQRNELEQLVEAALREHFDKRTELMETYAAAFVKEVGCAEASKYMLVERRSENGQVTTWTFELRSEEPLA